MFTKIVIAAIAALVTNAISLEKELESCPQEEINLSQVESYHRHRWAQEEPEAATQGSPKGQEKKNGVGAAEEVKNKDAERKLCDCEYY